ncbi:MAG: hypothetical protein Q7S08_03055 [bacterium]|nr:hypothetical protein [bacterium]
MPDGAKVSKGHSQESPLLFTINIIFTKRKSRPTKRVSPVSAFSFIGQLTPIGDCLRKRMPATHPAEVKSPFERQENNAE